MKEFIFKTDDQWAPLIIRLTLATVVFPHGAQKLLGWYSGFGFEGSMQYFTDQLGLPWLIGFLVILIEFFFPLFLVFGLAVRITSVMLFGLFIGIVFSGAIEHGFFMNWLGNQAGEGIEFHLLVLGMAASLVISGGGKLSLDQRISKMKNTQDNTKTSEQYAYH